MDLRDLIVIKEERDKEGSKKYIRMDTNQTLFEDDVEVLKEAPVIIARNPHSEIGPTIKMNHLDRAVEANALLVGKALGEQYDDYYPASFCKIRIY